MLRYACTNPWCLYTSHYTPTCPWPRPSRDRPIRRRYISRAQMEASSRLIDQFVEGDFDLRRTPRYMRERNESRPDPRPDGPGHGWLLVFVPVAVLVVVVMVVLVLYL